MTVVNYALGLGAIVSLLFAFWTNTLNVIIDLAYSRYEAVIYLAGLLILLGVPVYQGITHRRILDVHGRNLALVMILCLFILPIGLQQVYEIGPFTEFGTTFPASGDVASTISFVNTTGNWVNSATLGEVDTADSIVTFGPASLTAQDTDERAAMYINWASTADPWNVTAFTQDDDPITCIGIRIYAGESGKPISFYGGWQGAAYEQLLQARYGVIYTSETQLTYIYITDAMRANIETFETYLATSGVMTFIFLETDASEFINAANVEFEIHFFTSTGSDLFYTYLLYFGGLQFLLAVAITKYWNPTRMGQSTHGYRKRFGGYYHKARRYSPRRYYRTKFKPRYRRFRSRRGRAGRRSYYRRRRRFFGY